MAEPPGHIPPAAGRGGLRASSADREQVISTLKAAFVQGRLDRDELEARAAGALTSRTYADLAALIADLPAGLADAAPPQRAAGPPARRPMSTAARAAICVVMAVTAPAILAFPAGRGVFLLLTPFYCMALGVLGAETLVSWNDRRFRRGPPPPAATGRRAARA
jgi:hypothetical protein